MVITVIASDASTLRYTRQSNETGFPRVEIFSRKMEKKRGGLGHSVKQEMAGCVCPARGSVMNSVVLFSTFWFLGHKAHGILAHQAGVEPTTPALEGEGYLQERQGGPRLILF